MADYDNKDIKLEDEESVSTMNDGDDQSLDLDSERRKNLSFSFDKLLSSLNMNRKRRDDAGIIDSDVDMDLLETSNEDLNEEADLDPSTQMHNTAQVLESEASSAPNITEQPEEATQFSNSSEEALNPENQKKQADMEETEDRESNPVQTEDDLVEPTTEYLQSADEESPHQDIESMDHLDKVDVETETKTRDTVVDISVTESEPTQNQTHEVPPQRETLHQTIEQEEFSYSLYQNGDGSIDYDKLVGETKLLTIDSIYSCKNLPKNLNESVFIIELYGKTLPDNLPIEVKRQSVLNILQVGSLDVDNLLQDAYNRIDLLNEVLEDVAQKTEEMNETNLGEIAELNRKIDELKQTMANRAKYQQKQNTAIGYEIQRIVNIVEFISPR